MTLRRKIYFVVVLLLAALACIIFFSWKNWVKARVGAGFAAHGLAGVEFTLGGVGLHSLTMTDIRYNDCRLDKLTVQYDPMQLLHGNMNQLHVDHAQVKQDQLEASIDNLDATLSPDGIQSVQGRHIEIKQGQRQVAIATVNAEFQSNHDILLGHWQAHAITTSHLPLEIPSLEGTGILQWALPDIRIGGTVISGDKAYRAAFSLNYSPHAASATVFTLKSLRLPWNGGVVSTRDVSVPIDGAGPIDVLLALSNVSLDALLNGATGGKAHATGKISGLLPLQVTRDGQVRLRHPGSLKAVGAGMLNISPDAIPGDNQQVDVVRTVLSNFHYSTFSLAAENDPNGKLSLLLALEGSNPDAYHGRAVKLNVHLTGDLVDLLRQSVLPLKNPQQWLEQGNAKH